MSLSRMLVFSLFSTSAVCMGRPAEAASLFTHFITRDVDKLMDGSTQFRFVGLNTPGLASHYDGYKNIKPGSAYEYDWPDEFEMRDVFKTCRQMGCTVVRFFNIPVAHKNEDMSKILKLVTGADTYSETAFRSYDKMLQLANEYGIRVIFPLIDNYGYSGGVHAFAGLYGGGNFYTDPDVKQGYKNLFRAIADRTNLYTGVQYKNDKAILCWETGNELGSPHAWTSEMAAYMKSVDSNHLVMDGHYGIVTNILDDPNVDIVSQHVLVQPEMEASIGGLGSLGGEGCLVVLGFFALVL